MGRADSTSGATRFRLGVRPGKSLPAKRSDHASTQPMPRGADQDDRGSSGIPDVLRDAGVAFDVSGAGAQLEPLVLLGVGSDRPGTGNGTGAARPCRRELRRNESKGEMTTVRRGSAIDLSGLVQPAFEASPMAIVIADAGGTILLVNRELERQFGYARAELLGETIELLVPDALAPIRAARLAKASIRPPGRVPWGQAVTFLAVVKTARRSWPRSGCSRFNPRKGCSWWRPSSILPTAADRRRHIGRHSTSSSTSNGSSRSCRFDSSTYPRR